MPEAIITPIPTGPEPVAASPAPEANLQPAPAGERPSWLPEGIESPEALAAAYEQMKAAQEKPEETDPQADPQAKPEDGSDPAIANFVEKLGLDPVALTQEIAQTGDINAEAKALLAKGMTDNGLDASMIDEYIASRNMMHKQAQQEVMSVAGGAEGWNEMAAWAGKNLTDSELASFNKIMKGADMNTAKLTVGNLYARFRSAVPDPGKRIHGGTGANTGDVFESIAQQVVAQSDARYASDPAFRASVDRKIERTIKAGGYRHLR